MLVIPRNFLVDEKEPFFKGTVSPFLSIIKRHNFVKENLSNSGPVVTTVYIMFLLEGRLHVYVSLK